MSAASSWLLVIAAGVSVISIVMWVDNWIDRRPGGRRGDDHLEHLRRIHQHQDREHVRLIRERRDV